jgi:periplasmic divalent cation tolerance protein
MKDQLFVYVTASSEEEADRLGTALVEERLAACVNILPGVRSRYWWEGKLVRDTEAVLIAKTRRALFKPLMERVKALHSYRCPCVVALPIEDGNPAYLGWIDAETKGAGRAAGAPS